MTLSPILLAVAIAVAATIATTASAHTRWVSPKPRDASFTIKNGPCGSAPFGNSEITTLSPGPLTVSWENSVAHSGAPFRIALARVSGSVFSQAIAFEECVLLDHIPSEENPVLGQYQIVIDIPDIDCEKCVLQLLTPSTDKLSQDRDACVYDPLLTQSVVDANSPRCYSNYHSCADITIKSNGNGGELTPQKCTEPSDWPWRNGQTILGGNPRVSRRAESRLYYADEIATWASRNGSVARYLSDAPERFHGRPDGMNDTDVGGGGKGGKVVLWLFLLGLSGGLVWVAVKKPEYLQKVKSKFSSGGNSDSRNRLGSNASSSAGMQISGPTGVRKMSGHTHLNPPPGVTPPSSPPGMPAKNPAPPPIPNRGSTPPPQIHVHVERPKAPPLRPKPHNQQVALS